MTTITALAYIYRPGNPEYLILSGDITGEAVTESVSFEQFQERKKELAPQLIREHRHDAGATYLYGVKS